MNSVTFLGTGTSQGIPIIGCQCAVCQSDDLRDKRLRVSVWLQINDQSIVIDVGPDFRQQMLRANVRSLDALLLTHEHSDHISGLDDIRPFNFQHNVHLPVYADLRVQENLKQRFDYIFRAAYPGVPMVELRTISKDQNFDVNGVSVTPIEYWHGNLPILGFRVGGFAYLTDFKSIEPDQMSKLQGLDILVISALHHFEHHSHSTIQESIEWVNRIQPRRAFFTHLSHYAGKHGEIEASLPPNIRVAYDGLRLELL